MAEQAPPGVGEPKDRRTIVAVFPSWDTTGDAIEELIELGVGHGQLGLAVHEDGDHGLTLAVADEAEHASDEGALIGVPVGALAGIAILAFAVPGVGPIGLGGVLVAGGAGAALGALVGGVTGSVVHHRDLRQAEALEHLPLQPGEVMLVVDPPSDDVTHIWTDDRGEMTWGDLVDEITELLAGHDGRIIEPGSDPDA